MTKAISRGLVLVAGLLAAQGTADPGSRLPDVTAPTDPRLLRIKQYFLERDCPAHVYAEDFVAAADQNNLDWRLLPSLSMVESTGGKASRNNNMFGWDNGDTGFRTSREGIYRVASRLNRSHLYRNKNLDGVLRTYNPRPEYRVAVKMVMAQFGPLNLVPEGAF
ncbi:MAG: hypothetical protein KJZ84_21790 [Bryobacteraceae bacterium]|nr:hypothetical protein [Bryobacteraceae bacterium]MCL4797214.1 hypothetical protein [Bryobacteraceae bacterium]